MRVNNPLPWGPRGTTVRAFAALGTTTPYLSWTLLGTAPADCLDAYYRAGWQDHAAYVQNGEQIFYAGSLSVAFCDLLHPEFILFAATTIALVTFGAMTAHGHLRGGDDD